MLDLPCKVDPIQGALRALSLQVDVHDHHIERLLLNGVHGLHGIAGFRTAQVPLCLQQGAQPLPELGMVLHNEDPDGAGHDGMIGRGEVRRPGPSSTVARSGNVMVTRVPTGSRPSASKVPDKRAMRSCILARPCPRRSLLAERVAAPIGSPLSSITIVARPVVHAEHDAEFGGLGVFADVVQQLLHDQVHLAAVSGGILVSLSSGRACVRNTMLCASAKASA